MASFDLHYGGGPESIFNSLTQFHRSLTLTGVQTWEMQWMPKAADLLFALVHKNYSLPLPPPPSPLPPRKKFKNSKKAIHVNSFLCYYKSLGAWRLLFSEIWGLLSKVVQVLGQKFSLLAFTFTVHVCSVKEKSA